MKASYGQIKIADILTEAEFDFQEEYSFPDLISAYNHPLRFDFCVFDDDGDIDFLIEFQGIQHYQPKSKFGGMEGLKKQQYYDMLKRQYCKSHGIKLVIIPYWEEQNICYDYIMRMAGY